MQIKNLSSAQTFGTVIASLPDDMPCTSHCCVRAGEPIKEWLSQEPVVLDYVSGMPLLVIYEAESYSLYYLDRVFKLRPGVRFSVTALDALCCFDICTARPDVLSLLGEHPAEIFYGASSDLKLERLYTFFYQEKEQGFLFSGESHPMPEFTYVDQGSLHSVADGQDWLLHQGDAVIYAPNQWHMQYADIGVAPRFVTISFDLEGGDLSSLYGRKLAVPQEAVTLLQQMLRTQERVDPYSTDMLMAQLTMLLLVLLREAQAPSGVKLQGTNTVHSENEIIRHAQQYISAHIREKLSVRLIAQQVDVSPSYLTVLFQKNLQISPGEYIRRIKLQESKQMIRENNLNFTEIAAALQYSTVHHFSRQFKEKFGITPTEYARSVR